MRKLVYASVLAAALAAAGAAVADVFGVTAARSTSATFAATTVATSRSSTCTADSDTLVATNARYTGTSTSSDSALNGPLTADLRSLIDTTTNVGTVTGRLRIDTADGRHTVADVTAIYDGGQLAGLATGRTGGGAQRLLANLSAGFSAAGGLTSGKLGGGSGGGSAVALTTGRCRTTPPERPARVAANGSVSAVSATSITVAGVTCTVPSSLSAKVTTLTVGSRASIRCQNGTLTHLAVARR